MPRLVEKNDLGFRVRPLEYGAGDTVVVQTRVVAKCICSEKTYLVDGEKRREEKKDLRHCP